MTTAKVLIFLAAGVVANYAAAIWLPELPHVPIGYVGGPQ